MCRNMGERQLEGYRQSSVLAVSYSLVLSKGLISDTVAISASCCTRILESIAGHLPMFSGYLHSTIQIGKLSSPLSLLVLPF